MPSPAELTGLPLTAVLGARLSVERRRDLANAVASGRRVTLSLPLGADGAGEVTLHLAPTSFEGIWVGGLEAGASDPDTRLVQAYAEVARPGTVWFEASEPARSVPLVANILDGVRSLIGIRDTEGRYLLVNAAMAEFYGVTPSSFLGRTPEQMGVPDPVAIDPAPRAEVGPIIARDVELTDATGRHRRFDIAWRHVPSADDDAQYLLEVATETLADAELAAAAPSPTHASTLASTLASTIAPRGPYVSPVIASDALAVAESKLELVLRNGGLVLIEWDVVTDAIAPSLQLARLLDVDELSVPATAAEFARFELPRDKARIEAEMRAHLEGERDEFHCEYRVKSAKGRIRWVIASGRVVERSEDGRPLFYLGTLQDVTETLETSHELQRQLARSQEAMRVSDELTREIRQLEAEIREISQREHERLGHDLHDGLGQELTGVSLLLKSLEDAIERDAPQLRTRVHSVRDMVEQSIATTRALAQGLSPVHLGRDGVAGALEQLAATCTTLYGIPVKYVGQRSAPPLELAGATDLYRIAQEAVRNSARHSGATEIRIRLDVDDEQLVVAVEDDGHGLPECLAANGGMGLKIMRYRASIIGASLEIGARDEAGGTVVRCTLRHSREANL